MDSGVKLWDMTAGKQVASFEVNSPISLLFSPQDFIMTVLEDDGRVSIQDLKTFNTVFLRRTFTSRFAVKVHALAQILNGRVLCIKPCFILRGTFFP